MPDGAEGGVLNSVCGRHFFVVRRACLGWSIKNSAAPTDASLLAALAMSEVDRATPITDHQIRQFEVHEIADATAGVLPNPQKLARASTTPNERNVDSAKRQRREPWQWRSFRVSLSPRDAC